MGVRNYKDLEVYQRSYRMALEIHRYSLQLPDFEKYAMATQIRKSSKSVCANIVEGYAKSYYSKPEFKRFLLIAVGSSEETRTWLDLCKDLGYLDLEIWEKWEDEYDQISKMLHGLIRSLKA